MKSKVTVIVPCYNEEQLVFDFYNAVAREVEKESDYIFEFVFVDDGSKDGTLRKFEELYNSHRGVSYLSFSRNFGKEAAMYAGLQHAKGDYVTIMDVDLQDDPKLLHDMLRKMEEGYDCCGVRRKNRQGEKFLRSRLSDLFYGVMGRFSDVQIVDGARDFRMMTRQMVDAILLLQEKERFSKGIFSWVGFQYYWLEYDNVPRVGGKSKWSIWKLTKYALSGIVSFSNAPLHLLMGTGGIISIIAAIFMLAKIIKVLLFGIDVHGYASTVVLICFFGGLNLFAIGLVGEYLGRVNNEVKNRPIYILKKQKLEEKQERK
ncbi:MAG: glycosyltransferase family 2 protein [Clostridium sp.]|nr:glycosyltransferase family 2 protein [Clostridium sp.]